MFKFIHASDIHLDSPLRGLEQYPGAPVAQIRDATRQAFKNLIDLAVEEDVQFVLIAGDIYDGEWKDYNSGLFFSSMLSTLGREGIKVFLISGNHDAASRITKNLRLPENVYMFSSKRPETRLIEDLAVAIHGQGFKTPSIIENLAISYPKRKSGFFNIGLLHTSVTGRQGHELYAPCSMNDLVSMGYDYWALGHVHKQEVLCENPWVVFSGNTQGRHIRETGVKGCTLITVDHGEIDSVEHKALDVFRWSICKVDASEADSGYDLVDLVGPAIEREMERANGLPLAVRLKLFGASRAHNKLMENTVHWASELRGKATDISGGEVWVEKVIFQTGPILDIDELSERDDAIGGLLKSFQMIEKDQERVLSMIKQEFAGLKSKLPEELLRDQDLFGLNDPELLKEIIRDVERLLTPRLLLSKEIG